MTVSTKSNQQIAAVWNRRLVVSLAREHGIVSRRQLSELTGLRGSTLTYIVRELIDKNVLRVTGKQETKSVGQKQILIGVNPDLGWSVGIDLRRVGSLVTLVDAAGTPLDELQLGESPDIGMLGEQLRTWLSDWFGKRGEPAGRCLGVGVGIPGIVDAEAGVVLKSTMFQMNDEPLADRLAAALACPVHLDHNANFAAIAESQQGAAKGLTDFVQFLMNHDPQNARVSFKSFGAALFLRGELYRGTHFASGELDPGFAPPTPVAGEQRDIEILAQPDAPLSNYLADLAQRVGVTLGHIVNFLDPQAVIIGGDQRIANSAFIAAVSSHTASRLIPVRRRGADVRASILGETAVAYGAALAAMDRALQSEDLLAVGESR